MGYLESYNNKSVATAANRYYCRV